MTYYDMKIFSMAVMTLNVETDLSTVNSDLLSWFLTYVPNFMKIIVVSVVLIEKLQQA